MEYDIDTNVDVDEYSYIFQSEKDPITFYDKFLNTIAFEYGI